MALKIELIQLTTQDFELTDSIQFMIQVTFESADSIRLMNQAKSFYSDSIHDSCDSNQ